VLMPVFADNVLHAGARGLGILMGASGAGALAGSLMLARRNTIRGLGNWVAASAALFGVALIGFAYSRSLVVAVIMLVPVGGAMMVEMASSNTLIQSMVPDALRGRVMSVYTMMFMGMAPFGALSAGAVAEHLGAPPAVAIGGVICIAASIVFKVRLPALRGEARDLILAQQMAGGNPTDQVTATGAEPAEENPPAPQSAAEAHRAAR